MYPVRTLAASLLTLALLVARADAGAGITYETVPGLIRAGNPALAAARARIGEARARSMNAGRLTNPDLETSAANHARFREWQLEIGISQRFPLTDRLRLEREIGRSELRAAEIEIRDVERGLIAAGREALIEVLALRERRRLLEQQRKLSEELATFLEAVTARGEGSPLDVGQAKLEAGAIDVELRQLEAQEAGAGGRLKSLLGIPAGAPIDLSGSLPAPLLPGGPVDPSLRPDYQVKRLEIEAATRAVALEQARRYDDIEAGVFAGAERTEDAPDGYETEATAGIRFRIPLPLWNRNEGGIAEARATRARLELESEALALQIRLETETVRAEMGRWARLLTEIERTLLPLAETQAARAEEAFRNGQGEIQTVFRSRERRLQLAMSRLDALRQFHLARARHDAALGGSD